VKQVAVVGGGIFGATAAIELASGGHRVALFEAGTDVLGAASGINQYRLHRGYHYPRSFSTATASRDAERSFRARYGGAVLNGIEHVYGIAGRDSLTSAEAFLAFLEAVELEHRIVEPPYVQGVEIAVAVDESLFDPDALRALVWEQLRDAAVDVRLGERVALPELEAYEVVVVAAYASMNDLLARTAVERDYQFEVVEKVVVRPPAALADRSIVILDGPFTCIDPFGRTGLSVMGHVVHAIHHTSVGRLPEIPPELAPLLNRGVIERPPLTSFPRLREAAAEFFPDAPELEHVGSMFTIRTVLPGLDATDERPTLVTAVDERLVTVFSGKIGTCVRAAEEVAGIVAERAHAT
jgi:glycine/D-amino acid oxidase-like deaminating enzyme